MLCSEKKSIWNFFVGAIKWFRFIFLHVKRILPNRFCFSSSVNFPLLTLALLTCLFAASPFLLFLIWSNFSIFRLYSSISSWLWVFSRFSSFRVLLLWLDSSSLRIKPYLFEDEPWVPPDGLERSCGDLLLLSFLSRWRLVLLERCGALLCCFRFDSRSLSASWLLSLLRRCFLEAFLLLCLRRRLSWPLLESESVSEESRFFADALFSDLLI